METFIMVAFFLIIGFALLVGTIIISGNINQWILNKGGTDQQWLIFGGEPPGLEQLRANLKADNEAQQSSQKT